MDLFYFPTLFIFKWFPYAILKVETSWTPEPITADHWKFEKTTIPQMIDS